jgi:hypothetical protein
MITLRPYQRATTKTILTMKTLITHLTAFELWFNHKFGWFFTNGMKQ